MGYFLQAATRDWKPKVRSQKLKRIAGNRLQFLTFDFCLLTSLLFCASTAFAQNNATGIVNSHLYQVPQGYIGITRYGSVGVLTRYDDSLVDQITLPYQGLIPTDLAIPDPASPHGYLLGAYNEQAVLYRISLRGRPEIAPVWESNLPPFSRIIAARDLNGDGIAEIAMLGASGLSVTGTDGQPRYSFRGNLLGGVFHAADSLRFIIAMRSGENVRIIRIDAASGNVLAMQEIADAHELIMELIPAPEGEVLAIAVPGREPRAYLFDPVNLFPPEQFSLPASPLALIPYRADGSALPAVLFGGYPGPSIFPLEPQARIIHLDYPLSGIAQGAAVTDRFTILLARDSLVLYDEEMELYGVLPSVGTAEAQITAADSSRLLVASIAGSRLLAIPESGVSWFQRNWMLVLAGAVAAILLGVMLAAARRYIFVRTIYNNLVRVPGSYGIIVITPRQRVRQLNQSARGLLEIAPYIPYGRHISEYLVSDDVRPVLPNLRRLFSESESFEQHIDVERNGSIHAIIFRGRPMLGTYGRTMGYLLLLEDATQRIERERLINWASVAHHIAHEMKTPLGTMRMTAEMLHDRLNANGVDGEHARATSRIIRQSARLRSIVDDLLTIARTEAMQKVNTDLSLLFSSVVHDFSDTLTTSIDIRYEVRGEDFRCQADVGQFTVAMRNLLENAAQAIGPREGGTIRLTLSEDREKLTIRLEDNGIGMSRETLANLFKPFYTERQGQGGSGIGTVIIKRVIEGHGGTIRVESERGRGTTFVIDLPRHG